MATVLRGWLTVAEHRIRNAVTSFESHDERDPTKQVSLLVSPRLSLLITTPPLLYTHL